MIAIPLAVLLAVGFAQARDEPEEKVEPVDPVKLRAQNIARTVQRMTQEGTERYKLDLLQEELLAVLLEERLNSAHDIADKINALYNDAAARNVKGEDVPAAQVRKAADPLREDLSLHRTATAWLIRQTVLDDEQRKLFDTDIATIAGPFRGFAPRPAAGAPGRSGAGNDGGAAGPASRRVFTGRGFQEDQWSTYVQAVVRVAKLGNDRKTGALSLLEQARKGAADYRKANEKRYVEVTRTLVELASRREATDADRASAEKAAIELAKPIEGIFDKLRKDLDGLLTDNERKSVRSSRLPVLRLNTGA